MRQLTQMGLDRPKVLLPCARSCEDDTESSSCCDSAVTAQSALGSLESVQATLRAIIRVKRVTSTVEASNAESLRYKGYRKTGFATLTESNQEVGS